MARPVPAGRIDVYPVGVLAALLLVRNAIRLRRAAGVRWALGTLCREVRYIAGHACAGNWRAARHHLDGYHAEHRAFGLRCGTGWTKRRAVRDLYRDLADLGVRRPGR